MRELILQELVTISRVHNGFDKQTMRWKNYIYEDQHISEVDFTKLSDKQLLDVYTTIIMKHSRMM